MHYAVITALVCVIPTTLGTYLPSIYWDPDNPILEQKYWHKVVQVKIFDVLTFICPNDIIRMTGREKTNNIKVLYQNLYVKEVPKDLKSFDGVCDTKENSTLILDCMKPKSFHYQNIEINLNQANPNLPAFDYGRDYIFFATSDGTKESLNTTSKNCTMVFRIHFNEVADNIPYPSCPLLWRDKVCETPRKKKECKVMVPQQLKVTLTTVNTAIVTWQPFSNASCNVTYYSIRFCYRERQNENCSEELVTGKQHTATLSQLVAKQEYAIKVRAQTVKGPGNYSDEITFKTGAKEEPGVAAQKEEKSTSIDGKSIAIGFVVGFLLAVILLVALWVFISRFYRKKDNRVDEEPGTNQNNPNFQKSDEPMDVKKLNTGYRESGQNWKLPPVTEENVHLYASDA